MGKGIAYQFKLKFPENNKSYIKACKSSELTIGKVYYFTENGITVVNLPTKNKWREKSKIEYIKTAMDYFVDILSKLQAWTNSGPTPPGWSSRSRTYAAPRTTPVCATNPRAGAGPTNNLIHYISEQQAKIPL